MIPLSYAQQRLWLLDQIDGPSSAYNISMAVRLRGSLDAPALRDALTDVVRRHEALRTVFPVTDGDPRQRILDAGDVRIDLPLTACPPSQLADTIAAIGRCTFALGRELPFRAALLAVAPHDHVLILVLHHIAGDGWSLGPLGADLAAAYAARAGGKPPGWADLPVQYSDYTLWQRQLLGTESDPESIIARQLAFWSQSLRGMPAELCLPTDRPRPVAQSGTGGVVSFRLGARAHARLAELARSEHATVFMVIQAGLAALLTRLGAGTDIPIGSPVAGRGDEALENLVGFFVNTLVLRTSTAGDPTFRELLTRSRAADLAAYANQDVPFERLVEVLNPPRSLARHPLFQIMLMVQTSDSGTRLDLPGLDATIEPVATGTAKFDLQVGLIENADATGIDGGIEYSADLFDRATVELIGERLVRLLTAAAEDPDVPIASIAILSADERRRILTEHNDTARPVPAAVLPELIRAQAARTPHAIALAGPAAGTPGQRIELTYAELMTRADALAERLAECGAVAERFVALVLPRSPELVLAMLASQLAGAAYVPIDPGSPADRIGLMISDADPVVTLTVRSAAGALPAGARRIVLDDPDADRAAPSGRRSRVPARPGDPAYLIYTSGSTGRPKGVVIEHRALSNYLGWCLDAYPGLRDGSVVHTSVAYDMTVTALFGPLICGGRVELAEALAEAAAPGLQKVTPSHIELMNGLAGDSSPRTDLVIGGEALLGAQLTIWRRDHPDVTITNEYGPTEATVGCVVHRIGPGENVAPGAVPIGRPIWNTRVYVLDAHLQPVPPEVPGELYLAGDQLARGYLHRSALTAERFVADPFGPPGTRMYRTGDLVRQRAGNRLDYLGRTDEQVKVRGFRIEPGEIETVLTRHPRIVQAAVLVREDQPGDRRLVAYVVAGDSAAAGADPAELREYAARSLPAHMVPAAIVPLAGLPVTSNGKLDRAALPAPVYATTARAPRTSCEKILHELFTETLGLPEIGIDDGFFELGGHSLLALRLIGGIRERLGSRIGIRDLFAHPTVAGLAARLDDESLVADPLAAVLVLRAGGTATPMVCLPPATGVSSVYAGLLEHINEERPVYGLQSPGHRDAPATFAQIVASHRDQLRALRPAGPYQLLGWSFGGTVAHALAIQLRAEGEQVELLTLLDAYPAGWAAADAPSGSAGARSGSVVRTLLKSLGYTAGSTREMLARARRPGGMLAGLDDDCVAALVRTFAANIEAQADGESGVFDGEVLLFTSADGAAAPGAWRPHLSGQIRVHTVPVSHGQMTGRAALAHIGPVLDRRLRAGPAAGRPRP